MSLAARPAWVLAAAIWILGADLMLLASRITETVIAHEWGILASSSENVRLVGKLRVHDAAPGIVSDVGVLGRYAYLGRFSPGCRGGVYVIDISSPSEPREVGFIPAGQGSYVGEGVQAVPIRTAHFTGDLLVHSNEICGPNGSGGVSLWDVTDPRRPRPLALNRGDDDGGTASRPSQIHSAFAWQQADRAYVVMVDSEEFRAVDIMDITDPENPVMIAETGLEDWPEAQTPLAHGNNAIFHDVVVRKIDGQWRMLLSYWDAGWIVLDVNDPARPRYLADSDYPDPDPLTGLSPPEGNAHTGEWDRSGRFIIGTDENFAPFRDLPIGGTSLEPPGAPRDRAQSRRRPQGAAAFGGWGYVHLLDARTLTEIDAYAVPEALDETFATGLQGLSVHEVAVDPAANLAYLAYHNAGFRVLRFGPEGLREVGHFIDEAGNNLWGVEVARGHGRLVLASDRNVGLYLFRYTGP